jgi:hypothetical protein
VVEKLKDLYPLGPAVVCPAVPDGYDAVEKAVQSFPRGSSNRSSGLTPDYIKEPLGASPVIKEALFKTIASLTTRALDGGFPPSGGRTGSPITA